MRRQNSKIIFPSLFIVLLISFQNCGSSFEAKRSGDDQARSVLASTRASVDKFIDDQTNRLSSDNGGRICDTKSCLQKLKQTIQSLLAQVESLDPNLSADLQKMRAELIANLNEYLKQLDIDIANLPADNVGGVNPPVPVDRMGVCEKLPGSQVCVTNNAIAP